MKESVSTAVEMKKRRKRSVDIPESVVSAKSVQEEPLFTEEKIDFDHVAGEFDSGYECSSVSKVGSNSDKNSVDSKSSDALPWWRKLFKKREKQPKICPVGCSCLCHTEKPIKSVAIDMALLTANANQLRILMGMRELCGKINWEQTRLLENGTSVPTGCDVREFTWTCLLYLVLVSILGQILVGVVNTCIFSFIQYPNKNLIARSVNSFSLMLAFFITCVNIVMTGIFAG